MMDQKAPIELKPVARIASRPRYRSVVDVKLVLAALSLSIPWFVFTLAASGAEPGKRVDFNFQVRPILSDKCFNCHGPDPRQRERHDRRVELPHERADRHRRDDEPRRRRVLAHSLRARRLMQQRPQQGISRAHQHRRPLQSQRSNRSKTAIECYR